MSADKSTIYTRQGDRGTTSLVNGRRVAKHDLRVEAYGTLDEANSWVGAALAFTDDPQLTEALTFLQHRLFNCSSNLATPPDADVAPPTIAPEDVQWLEQAIDRLESRTGPLDHFVLPGGTRAAGLLHVARTVCRRAERRVTELAAQTPVDPHLQQFVNRASDLLFTAARYASAIADQDDPAWDPDLPRPDSE